MATTKKAPVKKKAVKKAAPPKKPKKAETVQRGEIVYPEVKVKLFNGDSPMTAEQMKEILGWQEVEDDNYLLKDVSGKKIRCTNNGKNRPYTHANSLLYAQEVLRGRWQLNGETMIIGKYGQTISVQHRGVALILAAQMWAADPSKYPAWDKEPTMDCIVVFGIDESDEVVNTIDTGKPRSLSDVIYRSEYFAGTDSKDRLELARSTQFAVGQVWERTGVPNAFGIRKTHSEALDLIARHPRILAAVRHVWEEDKEGSKLTKYAGGQGYAAGLMFLMGCAASVPDEYRKADPPNEDMLDWSLWEKAEDFWVGLAKGDKKFAAMREALQQLITFQGPEGQVVPGGRNEKIALIVKAWNEFAQDKPITADSLNLKYAEESDDGVHKLIECPTVGGIDIGIPKDVEEAEGDAEAPTVEQITQRAEEIKQQAQKAPPRKATTADVGHKVYVVDPSNPEAAWHGELVSIEGEEAKVKAGKGLASHGKTFGVALSQVQTTAP